MRKWCEETEGGGHGNGVMQHMPKTPQLFCKDWSLEKGQDWDRWREYPISLGSTQILKYSIWKSGTINFCPFEPPKFYYSYMAILTNQWSVSRSYNAVLCFLYILSSLTLHLQFTHTKTLRKFSWTQ